jgi:Tol biopolymer transport system component
MTKEATIVGALAAVAAGVCATVWGESARASFPGEPGRIAFMSNRDGDLDIYTMQQNGKDIVQLTNDPAADQFPSWSADGSKIAFTRTVAGKLAIFVMNVGGSDQTQLTFGPANDAFPTFSPEARRSPSRATVTAATPTSTS